jgi:FixJ family two-component response regulator
MNPRNIIFIVDDEIEVRNSLRRLLKAEGIASECFASAEELLATAAWDRAACLVLDIRLPGMSGLELQAELERTRGPIPFIAISGHATVPDSIRAYSGGAMAFFEKPFDQGAFLAAIHRALNLAQFQGDREALLADFTHREQEVLKELLAAQTVKEIAKKLEISASTVEKHRATILLKSRVDSVAQLINHFHEPSPLGLMHLNLAKRHGQSRSDSYLKCT